jgi:hypothetical protein
VVERGGTTQRLTSVLVGAALVLTVSGCAGASASASASGAASATPNESSSASSTPDASPAGTWTATGDMIEVRANAPTATLLLDGTVLVAGGESGSVGSNGPLASVEVYDPSTGSWTATGSMIEGRSQYTATLLLDGTVLVAGGYGGSGTLTSAELYDPSTRTWTVTGSMTEARDFASATLLPDGTVLVAGGGGPVIPGGHTSSFDLLASAELFDPRTGSWTATGSMNEARYFHTATLLRNGTVLVIGAMTGSAELYDPSTRTWTVTGSMTEARDIASATLLPDGTVLVAGGYSSSRPLGLGMLASAELFDPGSGTWTATGSMITARSEYTATLLPDGKVLVAGGNSGSSVIGMLASAELFDPGSGTWTATGSMIEARDGHTATLLPDGRVLVALGVHQTGCTPGTPCSGTIDPLASAELYDPRSGD